MTTKGKNMKSIVVTCANCGKQVKKYCSQVAKSKAYYCSRSCYYQAKSKGMSLPDQRGPKNPFWKGGVSSVAKVCLRCGKEFRSYGFDSRFYCSPECWYKDNTKRVSKNCVVCGNEFEAMPGKIELGFAFLCSKKCVGKWLSEHYSGENNRAYGIPLSREHRMKIRESNIRSRCGNIEAPLPDVTQKDRKNILFYEWRRGVVSVDGKRCVRCGERPVKVHAHHVLPYSIYPELGVDPDNGITLCEDCHKIVHSADFMADIEGNAMGCSVRGDYAAVY